MGSAAAKVLNPKILSNDFLFKFGQPRPLLLSNFSLISRINAEQKYQLNCE